MNAIINLLIIPKNWFLWKLCHDHTKIIFAGDKHFPIEWVACIQHINGGQLKTGNANSPQKAFKLACKQVIKE